MALRCHRYSPQTRRYAAAVVPWRDPRPVILAEESPDRRAVVSIIEPSEKRGWDGVPCQLAGPPPPGWMSDSRRPNRSRHAPHARGIPREGRHPPHPARCRRTTARRRLMTEPSSRAPSSRLGHLGIQSSPCTWCQFRDLVGPQSKKAPRDRMWASSRCHGNGGRVWRTPSKDMLTGPLAPRRTPRPCRGALQEPPASRPA